MDERLALTFGSDREGVSRKIVTLDDAQRFKLEAPIRAFRAGFFKKDWHGNREPVSTIAPGMLAGNAVEPALAAAGDAKIRGINGKHPAVFRHAPVKPVRDGER